MQSKNQACILFAAENKHKTEEDTFACWKVLHLFRWSNSDQRKHWQWLMKVHLFPEEIKMKTHIRYHSQM